MRGSEHSPLRGGLVSFVEGRAGQGPAHPCSHSTYAHFQGARFTASQLNTGPRGTFTHHCRSLGTVFTKYYQITEYFSKRK